jgi:hypothetical protein
MRQMLTRPAMKFAMDSTTDGNISSKHIVEYIEIITESPCTIEIRPINPTIWADLESDCQSALESDLKSAL